MMWMTPLERRTSGRMMRASAKADELLLPPLPPPEELDSEADAESVDEDDSEDESDNDSVDESMEEESDADDEEELESPPPPPEGEFKLPPTDTKVPVELVLKLNGWPEAEKNSLELSSVE
jgi:hypothetical protein